MLRYILARVHKTTLLVDDRKIARARKILGTKGIRDTIERALDEVLVLDARVRHIERLRKMDGLDLDKPEVMARAWGE